MADMQTCTWMLADFCEGTDSYYVQDYVIERKKKGAKWNW